MEKQQKQSSFRRAYLNSKKNKDSIDAGKPVIIPFRSFPKLSQYIPGILKNEQIIVTASTGVGKSRISRKMFIKDPLKFAKEKQMPVKVILNSLEESPEKVSQTLISEILYRKHGISLNFYELSNQTLNSLSDEIMNKYDECVSIAEEIYKDLIIVNINSATGFYQRCRSELAKLGDYTLKGKRVNEGEQWDTFTYYDPNQLFINITDTVDKLQAENIKGVPHNQYQVIKFFSSVYLDSRLRRKCGTTNVLIQQQVNDKEKVETTYKGRTIVEKMKPSLSTLAKCKATQEDATLAFGLFDPKRVGEEEYNGIDLTNPNLNFRSLSILKAREASIQDKEIPLQCNFLIDEFKEMNI
jgi:hypothetical protein